MPGIPDVLPGEMLRLMTGTNCTVSPFIVVSTSSPIGGAAICVVGKIIAARSFDAKYSAIDSFNAGKCTSLAATNCCSLAVNGPPRTYSAKAA